MTYLVRTSLSSGSFSRNSTSSSKLCEYLVNTKREDFKGNYRHPQVQLRYSTVHQRGYEQQNITNVYKICLN